MNAHGVIGLFWFEDKDGDTMIVNSERYRAVLVQLWTALGRKRDVRRDKQWFQQDGAAAHTANQTTDVAASKV
jgi:hypothetical protein